MIRKPKADDFREGMAVTVLRGSKTLAIQTGKGAGEGVRKIAFYWLAGTMTFGLLMSLIPAIGFFGFVVMVAGACLCVREMRASSAKKAAAAAHREVEPWRAESIARAAPVVGHGGALELDSAAVVKRAATLVVVAIFLCLLANLGFLTSPLMIVGVGLFALAVLLCARLFGDRVVLRHDDGSVTVTGLLGSGAMMWIDVDDISVQTCSRFNPRILFSSGARRNLVISGRHNRLGGATDFYVPIELLGLDEKQLVALISSLLCLRAGLAGPVATRGVTAPPPQDSYGLDEGFDPDAIMARYLAGRRDVIAEARPDLQRRPLATPPAFGRKTAR